MHNFSMPCACLIPVPNFPTNCEWGPILWRLLHGLADKYGQVITPLFKQEEDIAWYKLILETQKILPCKECKAHYATYLVANNPSILKSLSNENKGIWIQTFFWKLHNEIDLDNNKPILDFDKLHSLYKNVNFIFEIKHFEKLLNIVFQYNEVTIMSWQNWMVQFRKLTSVYGL